MPTPLMLTPASDSCTLNATVEASATPGPDRGQLNEQLNSLLETLPDASLTASKPTTENQHIQDRFIAFTRSLEFNFEKQAPSLSAMQHYLKDELGDGLLAKGTVLPAAVGLRWVSINAEQDQDLQLALENGRLSFKGPQHTPDASAN